jgi:hypothetical protein
MNMDIQIILFIKPDSVHHRPGIESSNFLLFLLGLWFALSIENTSGTLMFNYYKISILNKVSLTVFLLYFLTIQGVGQETGKNSNYFQLSLEELSRVVITPSKLPQSAGNVTQKVDVINNQDIETNILSRIEVQRGPASVLYPNYLSQDFAGNQSPLAGTVHWIVSFSFITLPITSLKCPGSSGIRVFQPRVEFV